MDIDEEQKRPRKMTEKGLQYNLEIKEKAANSAINNFNARYNQFHETLQSCHNAATIQQDFNDPAELFNEANRLLNELINLDLEEVKVEQLRERMDNVATSLKTAHKATKHRLSMINEDNASQLSRKSSRSSVNSSRSAMLKAKARRAALQEQLKLSDAIHEQQKALARLKLQQEINATHAEEEIYRIETELDEDQMEDVTARTPPTNLFQTNQIPRWMSAFENNKETSPQTNNVVEKLTKPACSVAESQNTSNYEAVGRTKTPSLAVRFPPKHYTDFTPASTNIHSSETQSNMITRVSTSLTYSAPNRISAPMISLSTPQLFTPRVTASSASTLRIRSGTADVPPVTSVNNTVAQSHSPQMQYTTEHNPSIVESIAKIAQLQRLPQAKPEVFRGDDKDKSRYFLWESAFDALVDSAPVSPQQKLQLPYQHLDGRAKKVVEQLQFMVDQPEIAYTEARKMLKHRFGHPAVLYTAFENKLISWPKIANNDARGMQEYSDFLSQVLVASCYSSNLKIFEVPSKIQALVEKLPGWFKTKWSTKVQSLQLW